MRLCQSWRLRKMAAKVPAAGVDLDGAVTVNESSASVDFRIESNGNANMLLVDGSADEVMIGGTTSKSSAFSGSGKGLTVQAAVPVISLHDTDNTNYLSYFGHSGTAGYIGSAASGQTGQLYLQTSGNNAQVIDENGHITKPLQPAFHVPGTTQNNIDTGIATARFGGTERFDQNSDFNTSTYTFTAPVTGKYYLSVHVQLADLDNGHDYCRTHLVTSNHTYYLDIISPNKIFSADAPYVSFQNSLLVDMDANDTAYVQINLNSGSGSQADLTTTQSYFSGFLAC